MPPKLLQTYYDPLHGEIALDGTDPTEALLIQLIDTPEFQRLRRIRQLGPASFTFHGAEASRFTHSLGVLAIARQAFDQLCSHYPQLKPHRPTVLCAALLHDLGHGPFSHTAEEIFGCRHESWTERILQESNSLSQRLTAFAADLPQQIIQTYRKTYPVPVVWQLVSSQLDCDRLDYLMRDSYFTGAASGKLDLEPLISALGYDPVSQQLVVAESGMTAVEHYLVVRYFMYAQVYNHPTNIAATWVMEQALKRASDLFRRDRLTTDSTLTAWFTVPTGHSMDQHLSLQAYLDADDGVFNYHFQQWQYHPDPVLADMSRRFVHRDLPKCLDISHLSAAQQTELVQRLHQQLNQMGLEPACYGGIKVALSRGYTQYQKGILIKTSRGLTEISQLSPLVRALTQVHRRSWLVYPASVASFLAHYPDLVPETAHPAEFLTG